MIPKHLKHEYALVSDGADKLTVPEKEWLLLLIDRDKRRNLSLTLFYFILYTFRNLRLMIELKPVVTAPAGMVTR